MSGIAASLRLDGSKAQQEDLTEVLNVMRRRGPEGESRLIDGPIAIGHRLLATTPEAVKEPMPLRDLHTSVDCRRTGRLEVSVD